jgi:hypothetical protein
VIEPDTANTAIVNVIDKSYDAGGIFTSTAQDRYRILANGTLIALSSDINNGTIHLVLTALPDSTPPAVIYTNPTNASNTALTGTAIIATFNEAIDLSTLTAPTFTISGASGVAVTGTLTSSGRTVTFTPAAPLVYGGSYIATITTAVKDLSGNPMSANYSWSFTAVAPDLTPPMVLPSYPGNSATAVNVNSVIGAVFSEAVDPATMTGTEFTLMNGSTPVSGTVAMTGTTVVTFTPAAPLAQYTVYTAMITTGVKDLAGNGMAANYSWSFTTDGPDMTPPTVLSASPVNSALAAGINNPISATLSEQINSLTIVSSNFSLMKGSTPVSGVITSDDGVTLIFTPSTPLTPNTLYTATISGSVQDLAGNQMGSDYSWSFTTDDVLFMNPVGTPTVAWAEAVAIGDVNGDGRNDVVMTTSFTSLAGNDGVNDYKLFVYLQNGSGGLNAPIKYATSSSLGCRAMTVAIGDINHDGRNDVVIGNTGCGIQVFTQNVASGLDPGVVYASSDSHTIRLADMNNDGLLDVVGIGWTTSTVTVWHQNAGGTLDAPLVINTTAGGLTDFEVGDVNNDGLTDIVMGGGHRIGVLTHVSGGTFNNPVYYDLGSNEQLQGIAVGDVNGDNLSDVVVTDGVIQRQNVNSPGGYIGVYSQSAPGTLNPVVKYASDESAFSVAINDVTGDGRKDVVVLNGVFKQMNNGVLQVKKLMPSENGNYNSQGMAVGDINGDGKSDVVIAAQHNRLVVLYHY